MRLLLGDDSFVCWLSGDGIPTVYIAVAGRSNGLGLLMAGNTVQPVINCPPIKSDWGAEDIWSSLRVPSGSVLSRIWSVREQGGVLAH